MRTPYRLMLATALLTGCGRVAVQGGGEPSRPVPTGVKNTISFEIEPELLPSLKPSAGRGQELFERGGDGPSCASCHGHDGRPTDPRAPDLSTTTWVRDKKPNEIREFIVAGRMTSADTRHEGVHGYGGRFSLQEQWDLTAYSRYLSSGGAERLRETSTGLFGKNCNVCHGNRGDGNGFLSPTMMPMPRNLGDWHAWGMQRTDQEIFNNIYYGVHWSAMPPWRGVLTEEQIWTLVDFIRSLQYELPEGGAPDQGAK